MAIFENIRCKDIHVQVAVTQQARSIPIVLSVYLVLICVLQHLHIHIQLWRINILETDRSRLTTENPLQAYLNAYYKSWARRDIKHPSNEKYIFRMALRYNMNLKLVSIVMDILVEKVQIFLGIGKQPETMGLLPTVQV